MPATNQMLYVPDASALELSYGQRSRKERFQRTVTLLAHWLHGHDEQEIAEMVGTTPEDVGHELQRALRAIERRRMPQAPRAEKPKGIDQMPEAVCDRCEALIPASEYRVVALAVSRDRQMDEDSFLDQDIFTPATRTFCNKCVMDVDEFVIANLFKCQAELMTKLAHAAPTPGEDAMDKWRVNTGHGGMEDASSVHAPGDVDGDTLHAADAEAFELSDYNPQALQGAPTEPRSLESVRRETLRNFLNDRARSWGKLKPRQREAVKLYVEGLTQSEIARRVGLDQGNISRMIQGALRVAR